MAQHTHAAIALDKIESQLAAPIPVNLSTHHDKHFDHAHGILKDSPGLNEHPESPSILEIKSNRLYGNRGSPNRVRLNSTPVQVTQSIPLQLTEQDGEEYSSGVTTDEPSEIIRARETGSPAERQAQPQSHTTLPQPQSHMASTSSSTSSYPPKPEESSKQKTSSQPSKPKAFLVKAWSRITEDRHVKWTWPRVTNWQMMKPVVRCAVAAWIGIVFLLIHPVEEVLGQAAFFALIVAFIAPPNLPFIQAIEQIFFLFFYVGLAWAWVVLAGLCVNRARTGNFSQSRLQANQEKYAYLQQTDPTMYSRRIIFEGSYIEAGPAIICSAFLGVGTAFYAWLKIHTQPSPFTFALVLGCVLMDVSLTIMHLFPYSYLTSGLLFMLPMAIQLGLAVVCSVFIFPESVGSSFTGKLNGVLKPIDEACQDLKAMFENVQTSKAERLRSESADTQSQDFYLGQTISHEDTEKEAKLTKLRTWADAGDKIRGKLVASGAGLGPIKGQEHYLTKELAFSRFSGADLQELFLPIQSIQLRCGGVSFFFDVLSGAIQHTHLNSTAFNVSESQAPSPVSSRPPSFRETRRSSKHVSSPLADDETHDSTTPMDSPAEHADEHDKSHHRSSHGVLKRMHLPFDWHHNHNQTHASHSNPHSHPHPFPRALSFGDKLHGSTSMLDLLRKNQVPVGIFESTKYLEMERSREGDVDHVTQEIELLSEAASPLLEELNSAMESAMGWLGTVNRDRSLYKAVFSLFSSNAVKATPDSELESLAADALKLEKAIEAFKHHDRYKIIEPYRHLLDPSHPPTADFDYKQLRHRALFWGMLFSYHIMEFSSAVLALMRKQEELSRKRRKARFWFPRIRINMSYFKKKESIESEDNGGPDIDEDIDPNRESTGPHEPLLGRAKRRDPDTMPFDTPILNGLRFVDYGLNFLTKTEFLFAIKAGLLTIAVSMPAFFPNSAGFFYYNRGLWVIVMAQLTLAVNSGDTIAAFLQRLQATFWGCLLGMVLWYISAGNGAGNRYGLGAVMAVAIIPLMAIRVHWGPGPPLAPILFTVSAGLVVGYSWINTSLIQATDVTYGWSTAWRRFVTVVIGTSAAMIVAQLPPVSSGKRQIRLSYASLISQIGNILCDILSEMHDPHFVEAEPSTCNVRNRVLAMKRKLVKCGAKHATIGLEVSLKGNWPAARYQALQDVCVDLVGLLSQLHHVTSDMPYVWRRAVLSRTRLSDSQFIGDLLAVISMCASALKSGTPLPQITPGPLVERLYARGHGLEVVSGRWDEDASLPKHVTVDVLESEEYLKYAISTTCIFSIVRRFDKLLLTLKTIVGEEFHLDHLDMIEKYAQ